MSLDFGLRTDWHQGTTSPGELVTFNIRRKFKFSSAEGSHFFSKNEKIINNPTASTSTFFIDFHQARSAGLLQGVLLSRFYARSR